MHFSRDDPCFSRRFDWGQEYRYAHGHGLSLGQHGAEREQTPEINDSSLSRKRCWLRKVVRNLDCGLGTNRVWYAGPADLVLLYVKDLV